MCTPQVTGDHAKIHSHIPDKMFKVLEKKTKKNNKKTTHITRYTYSMGRNATPIPTSGN